MNQDLSFSVGKRWLLIIVGVLVLAAIGYLGWYYFSGKNQTVATDQTPMVSPTIYDIASTASVTPAPVVTSKVTQTSTPTPTASAKPTTTSTPTPTSTVAPKISNVNTADNNTDGKIDEIDIGFLVTDNSVYDCGVNTDKTSAAGFTVKGYTIKSAKWEWGGDHCQAAASEPSLLELMLKEGDSYDSGATPLVTYQASQGDIKSDSGAPLASFDIKAKDGVSPIAVSAVATDTNSQTGIQAGDKVVITFSEPIQTDPKITSANINKILPLNNGHSWLDGSGNIGSVSLSTDGTTMTIILSATTSAPTVAIGDSINLGNGADSITDTSSNTNSITDTDNKIQITGSL